MSTISAGTTTTTALVQTGDTTGNLVLATGSVPTTALTLDSTTQAAAFAGAVTAPSVTATTISTTGTINTANTFGFKNRIINGGMTINQRGNPATVNATQIFVSDRWRTGSNATAGWGSGAFSSSQSTDAPSGFINSTLLTVTTAYTPSGNVAATLVQPIEGLNIADLAWGTSSAKTVTLSFWVKSSLTGTFSGMLASNGSTTRGYVFSYAISVANTWEQKTITIAGDVSSASNWLTTNGVGMYVRFSLGAAGTSLYSTANTWFNMTVEDGLTGQTNLVATNGATWRLTGVQLEVGSQATSFDFRSYGTELALCQRYYEISYTAGVTPGTATTVGATQLLSVPSGYPIYGVYPSQVCFMTSKRTTPTMTSYSNNNGASGNYYVTSPAGNVASNAFSATSSNGFTASTGANVTNPGGYIQFQWTASAEL